MKSEQSQADLFGVPKFNTVSALLNPDGGPATIVVGCGRRKLPSTAEARSLYVSRRFQSCRTVAETLEAPYLVLSGRHGIVAPETSLAPYDTDIGQLSRADRDAWANEALNSLSRLTAGQIVLLATSEYADPVLVCNTKRPNPLPIIAPLSSLEAHHHQDWLKQATATAARIRDLTRLYDLIGRVREDGRTFRLRDLGAQNLPLRGVYVFLDPAEFNFRGTGPRIVRIGTHAVSLGSKSTLKTRLRNHLGLGNGSGSHRGSIFRLHVGRAMLEVGYAAPVPSWGIGQDASEEVRATEQDLEKEVSKYLANLEVFIVPIDDPPSKNSQRARVETQLIALCTENFVQIDKPGNDWLGLHSPMAPIASSGLWNLRDTGAQYRPAEAGSVTSILVNYSNA